MKKAGRFFIGMSVLQSFTFLSFADTPPSEPERSSFDVFIPNLSSGFELSGGALFLKPSADNLGWAAVTDFLPIVTPNWSIETLSPSFQSAFDVEARYIFSNTGIDTELYWAHMRSSDSESRKVTPILQWISPFCQTGPSTSNTTYDATGVGQLTEASGQVDFHYDVINFDVGTFVNIGANTQIRLFSGLSGVMIKEELTSSFQNPSGLPVISLNNTSHYWGVGPRLGFTSFYKLYKDFRFTGEIAGSLLFGQMTPAQYAFKGSSAALNAVGIAVNSEGISSNSTTQTVPSLDAKLGFTYAYHFFTSSILTLEAGYMGAIYINPLSGYETNENILPLELGSLSTGSMKHIQSNFSVNGPYVTISLKF